MQIKLNIVLLLTFSFFVCYTHSKAQNAKLFIDAKSGPPSLGTFTKVTYQYSNFQNFHEDLYKVTGSVQFTHAGMTALVTPPSDTYTHIFLDLQLIEFIAYTENFNDFTVRVTDGNWIRDFVSTSFRRTAKMAFSLTDWSITHRNVERAFGLLYFSTTGINTASLSVTVTFNPTNDPLATQETYVKHLQVWASTCGPACNTCSDTDQQICTDCNGTTTIDTGVCICPAGTHRSVDSIASSAGDGLIKCLPNDTKCSSFTTHTSITESAIDYCQSCNLSNSSLNFFKRSFDVIPDTILGDTCSCIRGYYSLNNTCKSYIEGGCLGYVPGDMSPAINYLNAQQSNINISINSQSDTFFGQTFYNINLTFPDFALHNVQNTELAFKMQYTGPSGVIVSNTYAFGLWYSGRTGLFLNPLELPNISSCPFTILSNGAKLYTCTISIIAFHPCNSNIYMTSTAEVTIGEGGVTNPVISVDSSVITTTIPCLQTGTCFINKDYSTVVHVCDDNQCLGSRTTPFQLGESIYLRTTVVAASGATPMTGSAVEMCKFYLHDASGNEVSMVDMTGKTTTATDSTGAPLLRIPIPLSNQILQNNNAVTGTLSLDLVLKLLPRRMLQAGGYAITAPITITVKFDSTGGKKSDGTVPDTAVITIEPTDNTGLIIGVVVGSLVGAVIIVGVVLYLLLKKKGVMIQSQEENCAEKKPKAPQRIPNFDTVEFAEPGNQL